ncbi:hypothetical protein IMSAGC017_00298 [Thomasclavelia cocleata]|uniref:Type I restriction modification DNA specificity domain-containing protein n=1 Tax=Thomasclavelia cocleata TaxID=69824 RepID=A0A829Z7Y4_9FIRM|nr:restriction endonuclease subunit S [Thomasclavelia cocleata]GFI40266.1 hypothetical protein IMSAGC017_00298 [Thomasclavelia cocleata]
MREMKDSGIEWIAEIPKSWDIKFAKHIIDNLINGYSFASEELKGEYKYPVVRIGDIQKETIDLNSALRTNVDEHDLKNYGIKENDILIALSGATVGKLAYINQLLEHAYINQRVGIIRSKYSKLLYYLLTTEQFLNYIILESSGTAQPNISNKMIKNFVIPMSKKENEILKITNYLDDKCEKIDRMIAKEKEEIEKLNEYKDSLIEITITKGLNKKVNMVKSELKWIDEIPKDWKKYKLSQLCSSKKYSMVDGPFGSDMKNEEYVDEGVPIVQLTNIKKYNHYTEKLKFITRDKHLQLKRHTALKGDIAIAKMMPAGRACILDDLYNEYVVAADAIRFSPNEIKVDKRFVLYCLNTYGMVECELESKGTTRIRISLDIARNIKLYLPKLEEQTSIADFLDKKCNEIEKTIKLKEVKIEKVEAYKKSLIYECVTGKREVE